MSKTKIITLAIAAIVVIAGMYFKVDIVKALDQVVAVEKVVDGAVSEDAPK